MKRRLPPHIKHGAYPMRGEWIARAIFAIAVPAWIYAAARWLWRQLFE